MNLEKDTAPNTTVRDFVRQGQQAGTLSMERLRALSRIYAAALGNPVTGNPVWLAKTAVVEFVKLVTESEE